VECAPLIPLPIVRLNRATILLGVILAYVLHDPLITTAIFLVVALAAAFGRRAALAAAIALAGLCFGCFLFYQFKVNRSRLFG
jgi:hypothetical protein